MKYNIAKEYTRKPGPREKKLGDHSGEDFRETVLSNLVNECIENNEQLEIDLDGVYGYPNSFLEEAFGGLVRIHKVSKETLLKTLILKCTEDSTTIPKIIKYIEEA